MNEEIYYKKELTCDELVFALKQLSDDRDCLVNDNNQFVGCNWENKNHNNNNRHLFNENEQKMLQNEYLLNGNQQFTIKNQENFKYNDCLVKRNEKEQKMSKNVCLLNRNQLVVNNNEHLLNENEQFLRKKYCFKLSNDHRQNDLQLYVENPSKYLQQRYYRNNFEQHAICNIPKEHLEYFEENPLRLCKKKFATRTSAKSKDRQRKSDSTSLSSGDSALSLPPVVVQPSMQLTAINRNKSMPDLSGSSFIDTSSVTLQRSRLMRKGRCCTINAAKPIPPPRTITKQQCEINHRYYPNGTTIHKTTTTTTNNSNTLIYSNVIYPNQPNYINCETTIYSNVNKQYETVTTNKYYRHIDSEINSVSNIQNRNSKQCGTNRNVNVKQHDNEINKQQCGDFLYSVYHNSCDNSNEQNTIYQNVNNHEAVTHNSNHVLTNSNNCCNSNYEYNNSSSNLSIPSNSHNYYSDNGQNNILNHRTTTNMTNTTNTNVNSLLCNTATTMMNRNSSITIDMDNLSSMDDVDDEELPPYPSVTHSRVNSDEIDEVLPLPSPPDFIMQIATNSNNNEIINNVQSQSNASNESQISKTNNNNNNNSFNFNEQTFVNDISSSSKNDVSMNKISSENVRKLATNFEISFNEQRQNDIIVNKHNYYYLSTVRKQGQMSTTVNDSKTNTNTYQIVNKDKKYELLINNIEREKREEQTMKSCNKQQIITVNAVNNQQMANSNIINPSIEKRVSFLMANEHNKINKHRQSLFNETSIVKCNKQQMTNNNNNNSNKEQQIMNSGEIEQQPLITANKQIALVAPQLQHQQHNMCDLCCRKKVINKGQLYCHGCLVYLQRFRQ